jgi:hypothetical protein
MFLVFEVLLHKSFWKARVKGRGPLGELAPTHHSHPKQARGHEGR